MYRKNNVLRTLAAVLGAAVLLAAPQAWAEDSERKGTFQFSIPLNFTSGGSFDLAGGSSIDVSDDVGFGLAGGYNLSERFFVGAELNWIYVNYDALVKSADTPAQPDVEVSGRLDASTFHFKGQYNILPKTITPFVGASFGWTYIDSNIASGPPAGICWWDPWWGLICGGWQDTYDDTVFSYGLNAGLRAEVSDSFFIEARYGILWLNGDSDTLDLDGFRLEFGWKH